MKKYKYEILEKTRVEKGLTLNDLNITKNEWTDMLEKEIQPTWEKFFYICDTLEVNIFDTLI